MRVEAQHELLGRHSFDLFKIRAEVMLHAQTFDEGVLVLGGEQALALHLVFGGQFEREYRRGCPVGPCPLDRSLDDGAVANVDAVKKAHGHGTAVCIAQRKRHKL